MEKKWRIKVVELLYSRVQYSEAIKYYEDHTPPEEVERIASQSASFYSGKRLSKIGRPTKKERRDLDWIVTTSIRQMKNMTSLISIRVLKPFPISINILQNYRIK